MLRSRRRSPYGAYLCAVISAVLLLLSVSLLYSRLSLSNPPSSHLPRPSLLHDDDSDLSTSDPIDELDIVDESQQQLDRPLHLNPPSSAYFFDPISAAIRRAFLAPPSPIHQWRSLDDDDDDKFSAPVDRSGAVFGSDDVPLQDYLRSKATPVTSIEDALLLKASPLRQGWGHWFEKKGLFLRKDRMFRSSFDALNPVNNPLLQDPDGIGVTGFTRGDRILQKWWMNEFKRVPFPGNKNPIKLPAVTKVGMKRKTLNDDANNKHSLGENVDKDVNDDKHHEFLNHIYADGNTWGYFPGLPLQLSFDDFMEAFFRRGKCVMKVFMVWNSPPWMYTVRHQRGLESLLFHHPNACVVVFSETIELDFFKDSFVKDGYKVAVVMPNLEQLLKDTPAHIFSSVWFEWRKTKFYPTHFSELIRLAALYKYGGIYLDSDVIVLKPISFLNNSVGVEEHVPGSALNGAVMAFGKHSIFIKECLEEFYTTYDDTSLRWNGADLLTRVARKFMGEDIKYINRLDLKVEPCYTFFPISSQNITRYFIAPETETDKAQQDVLLEKIMHESLAFHFWNSLTSALIPEPDSLVTRLINRACIRCSELL